jgi:MerR family copper efflux transcriptional regulator
VSPLKIGQVAERAGVGVETIRFYERRGLIEEPPRSASGHRYYTSGAVERLRFIQRAKELDFTLSEIQELLLLRDDTDRTAREIKSRVREKVGRIEEKLSYLRKIKAALERLADTCDELAPISACRLFEVLEGEEGEEEGSSGDGGLNRRRAGQKLLRG